MTDLFRIDWSSIPAPSDDGEAVHLDGAEIPSIRLAGTHGEHVDLSRLSGIAVVYAYPMTGHPGAPLPEGWDMIPGARGCTPQSCAFRDHFDDLRSLGASHLFGLSTQDTTYQEEAAVRLHLPFALLSDEALQLANALRLPTFTAAGMTLLKRLTMIISGGRIRRVFYPVFPPDRSAADVMEWLKANRSISAIGSSPEIGGHV